MLKKKLTLIQGIIGLIPTALIIAIMIFYVKKKESKTYFDVSGTYFGYIREGSEEPLLFKLVLNTDSIGNYLSLNDSKKRYYLDDHGDLEVVIQNKIDSNTFRKKEINLKLTQHRAENIIHWHETIIIIDTLLFEEVIYSSESKGKLFKKSIQRVVFPLN